MDDKIILLQKILDNSRYTVALCGSGMMEEGGFIGVKKGTGGIDIYPTSHHDYSNIFGPAN